MKRFLSLILLITVLLSTCTFATYADGALPLGDISTEPMEPIEEPRQPLKEAYTQEEIQAILSGSHNFDIPEEGLIFNSENFPLLNDDGTVSLNTVNITDDD